MYNSSGREYILELDMNLNHTIFNNNLAYIKREIGKKNAKQLADELSIPPWFLRRQLKKHRISWTRHYVKHDYFATWSHNMAYILGFITADGCVRSDRDAITISLSRKDEYILQFILDNIKPRGNIRHYSIVQSNNKFHYSSIEINSNQIVNDLAAYYVAPRKTGKEVLPVIPNEFLGDYVRGFFDGDGTVHNYNGILKSHISNTCERFCYDLIDRLQFGKLLLCHKQIMGVRFEQHDSQKLKRLMYDGHNRFALKRKKDVFFSSDITIRIHNYKLTWDIVNDIRSKFTTKNKYKDICKYIDVTYNIQVLPETVSNIMRGLSWRNE
jgi:hypothetical protein